MPRAVIYRQGSDPLVPIVERMILDQVKKISGRHLEEIFVKMCAIGSGLRLSESRKQKGLVFNSGRAPELIYLTLVQSDDLVKSEKFRIQTYLARFFIILP